LARKARGELITLGDIVSLQAKFRDQDGSLIDADSYPTIQITTPSGLSSVGPTSAGVSRVSTGIYQFDYTVNMSPGNYGVWTDNWVGYINSFRVEASFNFLVSWTDDPGPSIDGYVSLGDDVGFDYSQLEIQNINKLLKTLRARLSSRGKSKQKDSYGNNIYVDCDIFSVDLLVTFLANSLTMFNEIPHYTFITFADTDLLNQFHNLLVEGAAINALASKAILEKASEQSITDSGINFVAPAVSEILNTQYSTMLTAYIEKLKFVKNSLKPYPIGLSSYSSLSGYNPAVRRLLRLRARQIF